MRRVWPWLRNERRFLPAILAVLSALVVTAMLLPLRSSLDLAIVVLVYMLPVGFSTALGGFISGAVAALASFLLLNYYFVPPYGSLMIHRPQHILLLVGFLVLTTSVGLLVGRMRDGLATARARENEAVRLYDLGLELSGLQGEGEILKALARHVSETFRVERVEILLEDDPARSLVSWPPGPSPTRPPTAIASLQGSQNLLGEIRLWREGSGLSQSEDRLIRIFTSQGALSLERTRLSAQAMRARILEESDQMKGALLSSVSHELRTPLATIKASVTSLRDESFTWDSAARADLLVAIEEETDNLNQLIGNLLNMSRIEAGALKLERQWNDLAEIIGPALKRARLVSPPHTFEVDLPEDLPLVYVDAILMEQVFNNLFSNSLKYSPSGSVIRVQACLQDQETIKVQVLNQGPAVADEELEHIFEKFRRVTAADRITGTGLGLSICKGLVEAHQGHIWAENLPKGFSIQFTLPLPAGGQPPKVPDI